MELKTAFLVGGVRYELTINEPKEIEALHKAIVLSNPRTACNECSNVDKEKFTLDSNKDSKGNTYVNMVCKVCGAKSKLGQYQVGGYFWREFEKYQPNKKEQTSTSQQKRPTTAYDYIDELA